MQNYETYYTLIGHFDTNNKEGLLYLPLFLKERIIDFTSIMNSKSDMNAMLLNEKKEAILCVPLLVSQGCGDPGHISLFAVRGYIPFNENTRSIIFDYKGKTISEIQISKNKPTVKQLSKLPKHINSENVELEWETYYDGDPSLLEHKVLYSSNNGETWQRVGERTNEQKMLIDTTSLPGGTDCRFIIQVTDGYNNSSCEINGFSIENKPNEVMIVSPIDGDTLSSKRSVLFNGQAYNYNTDEEITEGFTWSSSIDGELGKGSLVQARLTKGEHLIQLHLGKAQNSVYLHIE